MKYLTTFLLLLLLGCAPRYKSPDVITGVVIDIPFNGDVIERISGTNGISQNISFVTDRHSVANNALFFHAADSSMIDFGSLAAASFDSTNKFTISCWIMVADTATSMAVLSKRGVTGPFEYSLDTHFNHNGFTLDNWISSGQTSVYGTDPLNAYVPIALNQWQHIAYVADGNVLKVYLNGILQSGTDIHNTGFYFSNTQGHLVVGDGGGYGRNYYFTGAIDDIKIYKLALSAAAVQFLSQQ